MKQKFDQQVEFVAKHYDADAFNIAKGLRNIGLRRFPLMRRVASAAAVATVLTAAAITIYFVNRDTTPSPAPEKPAATTPAVTDDTPKTIILDNASLPEIVNALETVYGVEIDNVPESDSRLTIHYEGSAQDALETINALLDTEMTIKTTGDKTHHDIEK